MYDWEATAERLFIESQKLETELAAAKERIADCEFVMDYRYKIIERQEQRCNEANARAEKAEAELAIERQTLSGTIKLKMYFEDEMERLLEENVKLNGYADMHMKEKARAERAEGALAFIASNGGTTHETECGPIVCNGSWCAEKARAALAATKEGAK